MQTLTTEQLEAMQAENRDRKSEEFALINVLSREQYRDAHIGGSSNIPVGDEDFVLKVEQTVGDKKRPVVVYCASTTCDASEKAARKLEEAGFKKVFDYEGGTKSWQEAGLPVEGEKVQA